MDSQLLLLPTLAHFKRSLKTELYDRAFDSNWFALMILPSEWLLVRYQEGDEMKECWQ